MIVIERMSFKAEITDVAMQFKTDYDVHSQVERYNVTPTQQLTVVLNDRHDQRVLHDARWGLFPFWAKDSVNTTKHDINKKPFLLELVKRNRCVIPCTGFYGAKHVGEERDPRAMHIVLPGNPLFGIAGIFDCFRNANGQETRVFTILTSETTGPLASWLPNLPIVLNEEGVEAWLNPKQRNFDRLQMYLPHLESHMIRAYPVTNAVHNDQYESPDCIRELGVDFA